MAEWDRAGPAGQPTVHVTLKGLDNDTYHGTLVLRNLSLIFGTHPGIRAIDGQGRLPNMSEPLPGSPGHPEDPTGASYYVIAVVLVYGMSIVMLIASHIKRKHAKLMEDRQIDKYLREFQVVKEKSSRDSYKNLKRSIMAKLNMNNRNPTYKTLSHTILPMIAVGLPPLADEAILDLDGTSSSVTSLRRGSLQASLFRHVQSSLNGHNGRPRRASDFDIHWRYGGSLHGTLFREGSVESNDSFRGRRSGTNSHSLPSTIEERESPSLSNEMSTVVEMSDDDSPLSRPTADTTPTTADTVSSASRRADERYYYRPISISRACRVYEIPRHATSELMSPGGVHVALPGAAIFNPRKLTPTKTNSSRADGDHVPDQKDKQSPNTSPSKPDISPPGGQDDRQKHLVINQSPSGDNMSLVPATARSPRASPLPSPIATEPIQTVRPRLYERRMTRNTEADRKNGADTSRDDPDTGPASERRAVGTIRKPLHIDVPVDVQHAGGRLSPQVGPAAGLHVPGAHPGDVRRSSWSPSSNQSPGHRSRRDGVYKRPALLVAACESARRTPESSSDRRDSLSHDSTEFCSETSSESDEVWLAVRQHAISQPAPTDSDDTSSQRHQSLVDAEYRGTGSTPLLTPKEGRKMDFGRDSRSESPAYSSDREKHLHQVTSV